MGHSCDGRWAVAAIYGPPGGDIEFWNEVLRKRRIMISKGVSRTLLHGDLNIHLTRLVDHESTCTCAHCDQSSTDRQIQALLTLAGLRCLNPFGTKTHVSGTIIDLVLSESNQALDPIEVAPPGATASSDHSFVAGGVDTELQCDYNLGFGRVSWLSSDAWGSAISAIDDSLLDLSSAVDTLLSSRVLEGWVSGRTHVGQRRYILDAAVWIREAWYTIIGHLSGLAKTSSKHKASKALVIDDGTDPLVLCAEI